MKEGATSGDGNQQQAVLPVIAYLFYLVLPALLLVDIVTALLRGKIALGPYIDTVVGGFSVVWLLAGLGALILSRDRPGFLRRIHQPLLAIYVSYVMLILLEAFAHLVIPTPPIPGLEPPGTKRAFSVDPNLFPGVHGKKTYTTNELGLRGPMPRRRDLAYRILAIGGSSTICSILDDSETWPHLLMEGMNASQKNTPVWVGNAGSNGRTTVHHLVLLQWLPGLLREDMLIFLVGTNDLTTSLAFEGAPTRAVLEEAAGFRGDLPAGARWRSQYPFYHRLRLYLLIGRAARNLKGRFSGSSSDPIFSIGSYRRQRASSPIIPLPDLQIGLGEYRTRLLSLASRCRELDLRCLFLTHPTMWRSDLSPAEQHLLWLGYLGRFDYAKGYGSAADLERAIDAYNRTLLDVCRQQGLECYDLASHIPKDTSAFYDDVHFNEAGSRLVAETLKEYLLSRPPFSIRPEQSSGK